MTSRFIRGWALALALIALPGAASAQEAVLTGTVSDSTGAVLPGVTVLAVNEATGNRFEGVTDERGIYRIPARVGAYAISAELSGFSTVARTGVQLLVGQTATVNLQMTPSTVQETVTVTAEAPLLNVATSSLGANINPDQVEELPVAGRNWMGLALLAPGSRTASGNAQAPLPDRNGGEVREFQLNLDGQQISSELGAGNQPKFSQDSIAEFQFISNRFDATQGRSSGVQVNVITKSGSNSLSGLFRTNFQSDRFNAEDPVVHRTLPVSNQQYSTAIGGPILRDKLHYYGNFEYERAPLASVWTTPYPAFNIELNGNFSRKIAGARFDYQVSGNTRLMARVSGSQSFSPFGGGSATAHPASTIDTTDRNREYLGSMTQVLSNRAVNEIKGGYSHYGFENNTLVTWSKHWQASNGITNGYPRIQFTGFNFNANANAPRHRDQKVTQVRDDFTFSYEARGRHDLRAGMEFVDHYEDSLNCNQCGGTIDARGTFGGAAIPSAAQMQAWFPDPFNADTWNFAALSPWVRTYTIGIGEFPNQYHQPKYGAWAQDDWRIGNKLTLNLGLRYDLSLNSFANDLGLEYKAGQPPFYAPGRPNDTNNIQPRFGFAYQLNDRTVLRGGSGLYFSDALTIDAFWPKYNTQLLRLQYTNDGRADFASNPLNGQTLPTYDQAQSPAVQLGGTGGELRRVAGQQLHRCGALHHQRAAGNAGAGRVHVDGAELEHVDWLPAPVRYVLRPRSRLRLHEGHQREGHDPQREPRVRPGDRGEPPVQQRQPRTAAVARDGRRLDDSAQHAFGVAVTADLVYQAPQQPVAGFGHLHALVAPQRGEPAVLGSRHRAVHGAAGPRQRVHARG